MGYPRVKYDYKDYSVSEQFPEIAQAQVGEMTDLIRWRLFYIHTMLILPMMQWAGEMPWVESGFRDLQLNSAIGSRSRQHVRGEAVDFFWKDDNNKVFHAFQYIQQAMEHQTGWCALYIDLEHKNFDQIHWALPLGFDMKPRKNPEKFWYRSNGGFHKQPPVEVWDWLKG